MNVGDLVQNFLTEQLGIILEVKETNPQEGVVFDHYHVLWTTQGESLFGPGTKEWCVWSSIDLVGGEK